MSRARLSVVIPAKDEGDRIAATVEAVRSALRHLGAGAVEIIVVDDGSVDDTAARASAADRVIVLPTNKGKGAAVRAGVAVAEGGVIAFTDADLSYAPDHLLRLLEVVEGGCGMAVGSRRHKDAVEVVETTVIRRITAWVFSRVVALLVLGEIRDTQCGVKAFSSEVAADLFRRAEIDGFAFDVELFALAADAGVTVCEVPVRLANRDASTVRVGPAAATMVRDLLKIRRRQRRVGRDDPNAEGKGGGR